MNSGPRKLEVHRHGNKAGAHDAVVSRDIFGAVGGKQRYSIAALQPAFAKRAGDAIRHGVKLRVGEFPRALFAAKVDDRDLVWIAIALDQVAEIFEVGITDY